MKLAYQELTMKANLGFVKADEGTSSIEYAIIASLIAVVIVLAVSSVATKVHDLFQLVATKYP